MRIALLHNSVLPPPGYGGIERIVVNLAYGYQKRGHEVLLISRRGTKMDGFECVPLPDDYHLKDPQSWLPANLDFLHAHEPLVRAPRIPYLVTSHGNGKEGEVYRPNTNFLSLSHARNHNAKYVVYNGIDPARFPFVPEKEDYVVFLAKTSWRIKNVKSCIHFARDLGVRLEIMGGTGISSRVVKYHGMIGEAQGKLEILSKAKALIYPTNWNEPCAVAPLEAMACGTPVLSSSNGCMPELLDHKTGVLCHTYADLLRGWEAVKKLNPADSRLRLKERFSLERMTSDYLKLIEKIQAVGELDQAPRRLNTPAAVHLIYKPTIMNRLRLFLTGKV